MAVGIFEAALYLAFALRKDEGGYDIALSINPLTAEILAAAVEDARTANEARTAYINLFQTGTKKGAALVSTARPTEACRGMGMIMGLHADYTFYFYANGLQSLKVPKPGSPWVAGLVQPNVGLQLDFAAIPNFARMSDAERSTKAKTWLEGVQRSTTADGPSINFKGGCSIVPKKRLAGPVYCVPPTIVEVDAADTPWLRHLYMALVYAIAGKCFSNFAASRAGKKTAILRGNNIASLLVGPKNQILAWGRNMGEGHGSWHGETGLIQAYQDRKGGAALTAGSRLFTSLEPCFMCAGVITHAGHGLKVYYGHKDPLINSSALDRGCNGCSQEHMPTLQSLRIGQGHMLPQEDWDPTTRLESYDEVLSGLGANYFDAPDGGVTRYLAGDTAKTQFTAAERYYASLKPTAGPELRIWQAGADLLAVVT